MSKHRPSESAEQWAIHAFNKHAAYQAARSEKERLDAIANMLACLASSLEALSVAIRYTYDKVQHLERSHR